VSGRSPDERADDGYRLLSHPARERWLKPALHADVRQLVQFEFRSLRQFSARAQNRLYQYQAYN
jgi:hypothetical protein